jgi:hypothetical protein
MPRFLPLTLLLAATAWPVEAQQSSRQFWPEVDFFAQLSERFRLIFVDSFSRDQNLNYRQGNFTYYLEYALKPIFRRELRNRDDVFRKHFLTFRAGYRYLTSLTNANSTSENRIIAETNARYPLPWRFVVLDRNRGDFRFVKGKPFSMRYIHRLMAERDFRLGRFVLTPFGFAEVYYYTEYGSWAQQRYEYGVQVPCGPRVVFETYGARQHNPHSTPQLVNALGVTLYLYF